MTDEKFFSGGVMRCRLPSLTPDPQMAMPVLKRLMLTQGELAQFHDSEVSIHYIAALELKEGSVRGNHYHRKKMEHVYLMGGEMELIAQEMKSGERAEFVMQAGDLVIIQPGVAHAFRVRRPGVAVEFAPTRFDPSDIQHHSLV